MTAKICLSSLLRHDVRLRRQMNGYEFRDFLGLLWLAAEGRDPAYLPARKVKLLRHELGLSSDDQAQARLTRFETLELIERQPDGALLITFLLEEDEDEPAPAAYTVNGNGQSLNGNGQSGNGSNGSAPLPRQKRRTYSNSPEAERARRAYRRRQAGQNGADDEQGEEREVLHENLTPDESKPHGLSPSFASGEGQKPHALPGENREVSRVRVRDSNTVSGGSKDFNTLTTVSTVGDEKNLTPSNAQNLTPSPPDKRRYGLALAPQEMPSARLRDVQHVMTTTKEKPEYRNYWLALWRHCHDAGRLDLWDEAVAIYAAALVIRPPAGPGAINGHAVWLKGTLLTLLDRAAVAYVAKTGAAPLEEVSEEDRGEIRSTIDEMTAMWAAKDAGETGEAPGV